MQKKQSSKFIKNKGIKPDVLAVAAVFLIIIAYVVGLSIRNIRSAMAYNKSRYELTTIQPVQTPRSPVARIPPRAEEPEYIEQQDTSAETAGNQRENNNQPIQRIDQPAQPQGNRSGPELIIVGGNNNPAQNQTTLMQQAAQTIMQNWQNLSADDQARIQERAQVLQQQIQNMNDQQRQAAMVRIQQQLQQWIQNGQQGIPDISLE